MGKWNKDKYQYNYDSIITNYDSDNLLSLFNSRITDDTILTTDTLIDLITSCSNRIELIKKIGIGNYSNYRNTINDMLQALGITL